MGYIAAWALALVAGTASAVNPDAGTENVDAGTGTVGPPAVIAVYGIPSPTAVGQALTFFVEVRDAAGNRVSDYTGTLSFSSTDTQARLPPSYTFTSQDGGRHTFSGSIIFATPGIHSVTATDTTSANVLSGTQADILVVEAVAPSIVHDANFSALVNQPYIYNEARAVTVQGAPPFSFRSCDSTGLQVDAMSGTVRWTPTAVGQYSLCVQANNPFGEDRYVFTVDVGLGEPETVTAAFSATPNVGQPTLAVKLDASASVDSLGQPPLAFLWSFGDGSSPGAGVIASHPYVLPGGYVARLSAFSKSGTRGDAIGTIEVTDASGTHPPRALIRASQVRGDGSLTVDFSCLCEGPRPIAEYRWDLGNGSTATTPTASATYGPGRYHVMLMAVDSAGLPAWDKLEIVVTREGVEPPECTAAVDPPAGVVPLGAVWTAWATASSDSITRTTWSLGETDTSTEAVIPRSYTTPGWYMGKLVVEDSQGLTCSDRVVATAIAQPGTLPPQIISQPALTASCGTAYEYSATKTAVALGTGPLNWSAPQAPTGFVIDPSTGVISWTPQPSRGEVSMVLRVEGAAGIDEQHFSVNVSCPDGLNFATACGCGSSGGGLALTALGVLAAAFARRPRRSRAGRL